MPPDTISTDGWSQRSKRRGDRGGSLNDVPAGAGGRHGRRRPSREASGQRGREGERGRRRQGVPNASALWWPGNDARGPAQRRVGLKALAGGAGRTQASDRAGRFIL